MFPVNVRSYIYSFSTKLYSFISHSFLELDQLTGVAAILRFPMPELEDESADESEEDD